MNLQIMVSHTHWPHEKPFDLRIYGLQRPRCWGTSWRVFWKLCPHLPLVRIWVADGQMGMRPLKRTASVESDKSLIGMPGCLFVCGAYCLKVLFEPFIHNSFKVWWCWRFGSGSLRITGCEGLSFVEAITERWQNIGEMMTLHKHFIQVLTWA